MLRVLTFHPLFSLTPLAQKKLLRIAKLLGKKETPKSGLCPEPRDLFEKKSIKNFHPGGGDRLGGA